MRLKTAHKLKRERRDRYIYNRYTALLALPGAMPTAVTRQVQDEYGVCWSSVWQARKRVEQMDDQIHQRYASLLEQGDKTPQQVAAQVTEEFGLSHPAPPVAQICEQVRKRLAQKESHPAVLA